MNCACSEVHEKGTLKTNIPLNYHLKITEKNSCMSGQTIMTDQQNKGDN